MSGLVKQRSTDGMKSNPGNTRPRPAFRIELHPCYEYGEFLSDTKNGHPKVPVIIAMPMLLRTAFSA